MRNRAPAILATALAAALLLSACTADKTRVVDGSRVVIATSDSFSSYNDATGYGNTPANNGVAAATSSSFAYYSNENTLVDDESFGSYEIVSEAPFQVKYTVAPGVTWSDGVPIDAADLMLAWVANSGAYAREGFSPTEFIDPQTGRFTDAFPADVVYFDGARASGLQHAATVPVVSDDRRSITLQFDSYFADWRLAFSVGLPAHIVGGGALGVPFAEDQGAAAKDAVLTAITTGDLATLAPLSRFWNSGFNFDSMPRYSSLLVGSGPYTITDIQPQESVTLTANPRYTGARKPAVETIIVRTIADPLEAVAALADGSVDIITPSATADVRFALDAIDTVTTRIGETGTFEHLDLQFSGGKSELFADERVRRAFLSVVPRDRIVADLVAPLDASAVVRSSNVFAPGDPAYEDAIATNGSDAYGQVDVEKAKSLLAEAGVTRARPCILFDPANPRRVAEYTLIRDSAKLAGFTVTDCSNPAWEELLGVQGAYDAALFGWDESNLAVTGIAARLRSDSTISNFSHYSSPDVDAMLVELSAQSDPAAQQEVLTRIDSRLFDDSYGLPLYQYPGITAWSDRVTGVAPSSLDPGVFWNVWEWQPTTNTPSPAPSR